MSPRKKTKVCNALGMILYCIRDYFIMWNVQTQEKKWSEKWVFVNDLEKGPGIVILKFLD